MNCNDVAAILDAHRNEQLSPAERCVVDEHLSCCDDCAAAWHAQAAMLGMSVPPLSATLLERAMRALPVPQTAPQRRHPLARAAVGTAILAGVAFAGVTVVSLTRSPPAAVPSAAVGEPSAQPSPSVADAASDGDVPGAVAATHDLPTDVALVETGNGDVIPLVRHNPVYPAHALEEGLSGDVQLKFDITAAGAVENVSVVKSSDAEFEQSAIDAVSRWRYLPRLSAGKRVRYEGVQTIIRFVLTGDEDAPPRRQQDIDAATREQNAYLAGLEVALNRLATDDLRGTELQLDEMLAVFGTERLDLWNFYGYLYTVEGNYARAIDAYETAVTVAMRSRFPTSGPYVPLAQLYFARHQYDMALKTLLRPQQATNGAAPAGGTRRLSVETTALLEKLRALGVTEETLVGR
jgi:TonB family protein